MLGNPRGGIPSASDLQRARRLVSASVSARWCQDPNNHMILRVLAGALPGSGAGAVAGRQQAMSERHQSAQPLCGGLELTNFPGPKSCRHINQADSSSLRSCGSALNLCVRSAKIIMV